MYFSYLLHLLFFATDLDFKKYNMKLLMTWIFTTLIGKYVKSSNTELSKIDSNPSQNARKLLTVCHRIVITGYGKSILLRQASCSEMCSGLKGYISKENELICFHKDSTAVPITKKKEPCVCGYKATRSRDWQPCFPNISFPAIDNSLQQCAIECSRITLLRLRLRNGSLEVLWCGPKIDKTDIIEDIGWDLKERSINGTGNTGSVCFCGHESLKVKNFQSENENVPFARMLQAKYDYELILNGSDAIISIPAAPEYEIDKEFEYRSIKNYAQPVETSHQYSHKVFTSCTVGSFTMTGRRKCESFCGKAKGYFLPNSDELICYHYVSAVKSIPLFHEPGNFTIIPLTVKCQCGIQHVDQNRIKTYQACVPEIEQPIEIGTPQYRQKIQCHSFCRKHVAFIVDSYPKRRVVRCELSTFSPPVIFEKLDARVSKSDDMRSKVIECDCGIEINIAAVKNCDGNERAGSSNAINHNDYDVFEGILNDDLVLNYPSHQFPPRNALFDIVETNNTFYHVGDLYIPSPIVEHEELQIDGIQVNTTFLADDSETIIIPESLPTNSGSISPGSEQYPSKKRMKA